MRGVGFQSLEQHPGPSSRILGMWNCVVLLIVLEHNGDGGQCVKGKHCSPGQGPTAVT
jgi:hypothetical protein